MNNYCLLIGRIANDFEIHQTQEKKSVTTVVLAVTKPFKNPETSNYDVDFIRITLWEQIAENTSEFCKKGDSVAVKCRVSTKKDTLENGVIINSIELIAEKVMFLSQKNT